MLRARYRRITGFFARVILSLVAWELILPRVGLRGWAKQTRAQRYQRIAKSYRQLAVEMGGVLIKVGQFLSARVDMLPEEITDELAGLQDEVPPEQFADIRRVAEAELGEPLSERFAYFAKEPLAAASLGQVHRARLRPKRGGAQAGSQIEGEGQNPFAAVVVKVQRPNIEAVINTDLDALETVGKWLQRYPPIRRRADVMALLGEFKRVLYEEIDYLQEGRNAETFGVNFVGRKGVRVPRVAWEHTTRRVLTLEDVYAIKITDYPGIHAAGVNPSDVADRLFDTYMQQIFTDGFFHADPHPGNLFVEVVGQEEGTVDWVLTFVDFGMVGQVSSDLRAGLREVAIAVGTRDARRLVKSYQILDVLLPHADVDLIERMESAAFERFWGKSMAELRAVSFEEMHSFAREFREIVYTMPFQIPQNLILLGRTVAILSGMCTGLNEDFNLWQHMIPYAEELLVEEEFSRGDILLDELGSFVTALLAVPRRLDTVLNKLDRGEIEIRIPRVSAQIEYLRGDVQRLAGAVIFFALVVGGVQLYLGDERILGIGMFAAALLTLLWTLLRTR